MEAVKLIGGGLFLAIYLTTCWSLAGRVPTAFTLARSNGISQWRVVPPYNRLGASLRCELWTFRGAVLGAAIGLGTGWMFSTLAVGVVLAVPVAAFGAWRCRAMTSILLTYSEVSAGSEPSAPRRS
jgi:hypothetical protein